MSYGPNWPPRPAAPQPPRRRPGRRREPSPADRAAFAMLVAALMMLCCMALWEQTSIRLDLPTEPHTTYATTIVGPPVHHRR